MLLSRIAANEGVAYHALRIALDVIRGSGASQLMIYNLRFSLLQQLFWNLAAHAAGGDLDLCRPQDRVGQNPAVHLDRVALVEIGASEDESASAAGALDGPGNDLRVAAGG